MGDFVWLSWRGRCKDRQHPSNGCTLFAMTKQAAEQMLACMTGDNPEPCLLDIWLTWKSKTKQLVGSYIYPALGDCSSHTSANVDDNVRQGMWDKPWCSETTVVPERQLSRLSTDEKKQKPLWLASLLAAELEGDNLIWKTYSSRAEQYIDASTGQCLAPLATVLRRPAGPPPSKRRKRQHRHHLAVFQGRRLVQSLGEAWNQASLVCT